MAEDDKLAHSLQSLEKRGLGSRVVWRNRRRAAAGAQVRPQNHRSRSRSEIVACLAAQRLISRLRRRAESVLGGIQQTRLLHHRPFALGKLQRALGQVSAARQVFTEQPCTSTIAPGVDAGFLARVWAFSDRHRRRLAFLSVAHLVRVTDAGPRDEPVRGINLEDMEGDADRRAHRVRLCPCCGPKPVSHLGVRPLWYRKSAGSGCASLFALLTIRSQSAPIRLPAYIRQACAPFAMLFAREICFSTFADVGRLHRSRLEPAGAENVILANVVCEAWLGTYRLLGLQGFPALHAASRATGVVLRVAHIPLRGFHLHVVRPGPRSRLRRRSCSPAPEY